MKILLLIILMLPALSRAQDTVRVPCSQEQAIKSLVEKGFAIEKKTDDYLMTKPFETKRFGVAGHNELLIRMTILTDNKECKISGEYVARNTYYQSGGKGWVPIYNKKSTAKTWRLVTNFTQYLSDEVSKK